MINVFHFVSFRVTSVEQASSINVAERVFNLPRFAAKRNQGYGDNLGDGQVVPSIGIVHDPDLVDLPAGVGLQARTDERGGGQ